MTTVFDEVADLYDRMRPRYPDALFDDLIAITPLADGARVLEVGCGTGQATVGLASRGYAITCLEPGPRMAAIARRNLAAFPRVAVVEQTLESFGGRSGGAGDPAFHLVLAAQAFHWVRRDRRFGLAADVLRPGGALAIVANFPQKPDTPLRREIDAAYARFASTVAGASDPLRHQVEADFAASPRFRVLPVRLYRWSRAYSAGDYVSLMQTHSDHIRIPAPERGALLTRLREVVEAHGTPVIIDYNTHLLLGYRTD
jgi:SAM-dependent methyltransferase